MTCCPRRDVSTKCDELDRQQALLVQPAFVAEAFRRAVRVMIAEAFHRRMRDIRCTRSRHSSSPSTMMIRTVYAILGAQEVGIRLRHRHHEPSPHTSMGSTRYLGSSGPYGLINDPHLQMPTPPRCASRSAQSHWRLFMANVLELREGKHHSRRIRCSSS